MRIKIFEDFTKPVIYQNERWLKRMERISKGASEISITKYDEYDDLDIIKLYQEIVEIPYDEDKYLSQDSWYDSAKRIFKDTLESILKDQIVSFERNYKCEDDTSHNTLSVLIIKAEVINEGLYIDAKYEPDKNEIGYRISVDRDIPIKIWKKGNELTKWRASRFDL